MIKKWVVKSVGVVFFIWVDCILNSEEEGVVIKIQVVFRGYFF